MTFLISSRTGLTEPRRRLLALHLLVIDGEREREKKRKRERKRGVGKEVLDSYLPPRYHPRVISYTEHAVSPLALFALQVYARLPMISVIS